MKLKLMLSDPIKRKERIFMLAFSILFIGAVFGIIYSYKTENPISSFYSSGGLAFPNGTYTVYEVLKNNFFGILFLVIVLFISGFFVFGQIIAAFALIYRGFSFGNAIYLCMNEFGLKGIIISLILIIPFGIFSCVITFFAVREAVRNSNILFRYIFIQEKKENTLKTTKFYLLRFVVLIIFCAVGIAVQAGMLLFSVKYVIN